MRTILFRLHGKRFRHLKFEKRNENIYSVVKKERNHKLNLKSNRKVVKFHTQTHTLILKKS